MGTAGPVAKVEPVAKDEPVEVATSGITADALSDTIEHYRRFKFNKRINRRIVVCICVSFFGVDI